MTNKLPAETVRVVPLEDLITHPMLLGLGWSDTRTIKLMVRAGRLKAEIDSKGYVFLSELSILRAFFMVKMERAIDLGFFETLEEEESLCLDFATIAMRHLIREMMDIQDLKVGDLKKMLNGHYKKTS